MNNFKKDDKIYYDGIDGRRFRTVVRIDGDRVWFTNGSFMPADRCVLVKSEYTFKPKPNTVQMPIKRMKK